MVFITTKSGSEIFLKKKKRKKKKIKEKRKKESLVVKLH